MNALNTLLISQNAALAPDGIPLHFGDQAAEYHAALNDAVVLLRSHEGRIEARGNDRLSLLHRISTNHVEALAEGEGKPTIFITPIARIIDRATVYARGDHALLISEPGRGTALRNYLQRNIFFNDDVQLLDRTAETHQFAIHGATADALIAKLVPEAAALAPMHSLTAEIAGVNVWLARNVSISGSHWTLVTPRTETDDQAAAVWKALTDAGIQPAGSLIYNALRIRAGRPGIGRELTNDYIPIEVGLWDEISFNKGCYTGQEIIIRMESRNRFAKIMVRLNLSAFVEAPAPIIHEDKQVGTLTSSVQAPDGTIYGIGVIRPASAEPQTRITINDIEAHVIEFAGAPPPIFTQAE